MSKRWVEISTSCQRQRFTLLSQALRDAGCENEASFIETDELSFPDVLQKAMGEFDQIRIGGPLCTIAPSLAVRMPSTMLTLRSADSFVKEADGSWWPRNYTAEGLQRALVSDVKGLDLSGALFLIGTGCEARSVVAAFSRLGFSRISISSTDESSEAFIDEMRASYFKVQFQYVPRHSITQLPSVHSAAVNTLVAGEDDGALSEMFYFNFLKPGGLWLDLAAFPANAELENEARSVGALVESGYRAAAWTDIEWAQSVLGVALDVEALASLYENSPA